MLQRRTWLTLTVILATGLVLSAAGPALGHALLKSSQPAAGSSLASSPAQVTITFTETPDTHLSAITVVDSTGAAVATGTLTVAPADPTTLSVTLPQLGNGVYTVTWRTVSSVDGHLATGTFAFGVGVAPPPTSASSGSVSGSSSIGVLQVASRWLLYAGLIVLLGVCWMLLRGGPLPGWPSLPDTRPLGPILGLSALAAAAGSVLVVVDQMLTAGVSIGELPGTSLGNDALLRLIPVAFGVVAFGLIRRNHTSRPAIILLGLTALGAMLVDVSLSHAGAGSDPLVDGAVQWLHFVGAGAWLGGLVALLVWLRRRAPDETAAAVARRFSRVATFAIGLVVVTGVVRAVEEVGTLDALFGTAFGWLVIGKSALLVLLAALGGLNHFVHVPRGVTGIGPLRRVGSVEIGVAALIVLLTAGLVNLAPPSETAGATGPQNVTVTGSDFGTTVRVTLTVTPGTAGINSFDADVRDYDSGSSAGASAVTLNFALPAQPQVAQSRLDLSKQPDGTFSATGTNLSIDGTWTVTAVVTTPGNIVEVPLQVTTLIVRQQVDKEINPGLPTIYVVHLASGGTVQMYLDPGKAGANELHSTFFDAQGNEMAITSATMSIGPEGQPPTSLTPRMLEPGHFVADTTLQAGTYLATVIGAAPNGAGSLVARADMDVSQ